MGSNVPQADLSQLLGTLTRDELIRLDRLLALAPSVGTIDLGSVVAKMQAERRDRFRDDKWRAETSSGRLYELVAVECLPYDEARALYQKEWRQVEELALSGLTYEDAWARVRREAFCGDADLM